MFQKVGGVTYRYAMSNRHSQNILCLLAILGKRLIFDEL